MPAEDVYESFTALKDHISKTDYLQAVVTCFELTCIGKYESRPYPEDPLDCKLDEKNVFRQNVECLQQSSSRQNLGQHVCWRLGTEDFEV